MLCLFVVEGNNNLGEHQSHFENAFMKYKNLNVSLFCFTHPHKSKVYGLTWLCLGFPIYLINENKLSDTVIVFLCDNNFNNKCIY